MAQIEDSRQAWLQLWQSSAIQLAASIAQHILSHEIQNQPDFARDRIEEALKLAAGAGEITIRLNQQDHQSLGKQV